jgi:hypothetical protein
MALSMYAASVPVFTRQLKALDAILGKAAAYAEARKFDPAVLLTARLYPDMFTMTRQVQIATDSAKGPAARLAGLPVPSFPDTEATFPELKARIAKTLDFIGSVRPDQIDGSEGREIKLKVGPPDRAEELVFNGQDYLLSFVLPNFFFHVTTAYVILRHNGLDIGKRDFLGA